MAEGARYRFEPSPRRGVLLGLSAGQVAVIAGSVLVAMGLLSKWPGAGGFMGAVATVGLAVLSCRPVAGRAPLQWAGVGAQFALRRRRHIYPPPPVPGPPAARLPALSLPTPRVPASRLPARGFLAGACLQELPAADGQGPVGVVVDQRSGTAAALLRARGDAFCLLDEAGKERKLAAWAAVLESVSSHRSPLVRLQWCQRAIPADSDPLLAHLRTAGDPSSPGYGLHAALLTRAGEKAWRHETFLVPVVRCPVRRGRLTRDGAAAVWGEVRALRSRMHTAGFGCDGLLDAQGTAAALGNFLTPGLERHPSAYPWPLAVKENWADLQADGHWHRTYWVAEWPRSHVGPDFLSPLLVGTGQRSFSVVMAPVAPERAVRDAESSRTAQVADAQLRAQGGFLETAQQRRRAEALEGREAQLAEGRGAFELAGYVTVSSPDKAGLERACSELQRAAGAARLYLRPLFGQQKEALGWVLPLGRGL